jgi:hypothetical protein
LRGLLEVRKNRKDIEEGLRSETTTTLLAGGVERRGVGRSWVYGCPGAGPSLS